MSTAPARRAAVAALPLTALLLAACQGLPTGTPPPPSTVAPTTIPAPTDLPTTSVPPSGSTAPSAPTSSTGAPPPATGVPGVEQLVSDMRDPHEGRLHGVPDSYDWSARPRLGRGNDATGAGAITAWGQVYEDAAGNPATGCRVALREATAWLRSTATGSWRQVQRTTGVTAAGFAEDFQGPGGDVAARTEPDGSTSAFPGNGLTVHFWPQDRAAIDPADVGGVVSAFEARLVPADPARPGDCAGARFLAAAGADYHPSVTGGAPQGDLGIGRHRYVTPEWQLFTMTTLSEADTRANPLPAG